MHLVRHYAPKDQLYYPLCHLSLKKKATRVFPPASLMRAGKKFHITSSANKHQ